MYDRRHKYSIYSARILLSLGSSESFLNSPCILSLEHAHVADAGDDVPGKRLR